MSGYGFSGDKIFASEGSGAVPTSPSASIMAQNIQLFGPRGGFLTHQWIIT